MVSEADRELERSSKVVSDDGRFWVWTKIYGERRKSGCVVGFRWRKRKKQVICVLMGGDYEQEKRKN